MTFVLVVLALMEKGIVYNYGDFFKVCAPYGESFHSFGM